MVAAIIASAFVTTWMAAVAILGGRLIDDIARTRR